MTEAAAASDGALSGVKVLDFSTLLPGPLASLLLAEAGAEVIKVERPESGDELRVYPPPFGSWGFALLNRGKKSLVIDLKAEDALDRLRPLIAETQVLIEQFRPGVMRRLGLGYEALRAVNPALVYCSITGYGQTGARAGEAGHDLNYQAVSGLLALGGDDAGKPVIAPGLIADIGGGSLPAAVNILLALRKAERSGQGCHLDIAMTDNLLAWSWWAQAAIAGGRQPRALGSALLTGGSPRYQVYRCADGRFLAVAALEERFWRRFCALIALPEEERGSEGAEPKAVIRAVARIIAAKDSADWLALFAGEDVCVSLVASLEEALADPALTSRGLFEERLSWDGEEAAALPLPLAAALRGRPGLKSAPKLGEGGERGFGARLPERVDADRMPATARGKGEDGAKNDEDG